ncbi:hypothetical protein Enr13x_21150 [Stieleria neptunia]|uniref:SLA1 homology domain-containing protein n=1 Tax=Stieleria neptunia TaxID=2527979 RepID=A0A518HN82_9BACT|nr:SHD1 domain-containing protein [Stieleria neptunia]QDV42270.1 hypothetical protein Enr13x_21150 [Stieleria neptunia]
MLLVSSLFLRPLSGMCPLSSDLIFNRYSTRELNLRGFILALILLIEFNAAFAEEGVRRWSDASGKFSVDARLAERTQTQVVLEKSDGRMLTVPIARLSQADQDYLAALSDSPPKRADEASSIDLLDPQAQVPTLSATGPTILLTQRVAPVSIPADPQPESVSSVPFVRPLQSIDSSTDLCKPIAVSADTFAVTMFKRHIPTGGAARLYRVQAQNRSPEVILQLKQALRFLDHHRPSGRTLAVIGSEGSGNQGGELLLLSGLAEGKPAAVGRAKVPKKVGQLSVPEIVKGRLIEADKAIVQVDDQVYVWSLADGRLLAHLVDVKTNFSVSGSGRFLAVGVMGAAQVIDLAQRKLVATFEFPVQLSPHVAFSPDGTKLATLASRHCRVWDLTRAEVLSEQQLDAPFTNLFGWVGNDYILTRGGLIQANTARKVWQYRFPSVTNVVPINGAVLFTQEIPVASLLCLPLPHREFAELGESQLREGKWVDSDGGAPHLGTAGAPAVAMPNNPPTSSVSNQASLSGAGISSQATGLALLETHDSVKPLSTQGRQILFAPNEMAAAVPADSISSDESSDAASFRSYQAKLEERPRGARVETTAPLWIDADRSIHAVSVYQYPIGQGESFGRVYVASPDATEDPPVLDVKAPLVLMDHHRASGNTLGTYGPDLVVLSNLASRKPDVVARWHLPNWTRSSAATSVENAKWVSGEYVVVQQHHRVYCWSLATGKLHFKIDTEVVTDFAVSPNGRYLAIASSRGCFLIDVHMAEPVGQIDIPRLPSAELHFSPSGRYLAFAFGKQFVVWDVTEAKLAASSTLNTSLGKFIGWVNDESLLCDVGGLLRFDTEAGEVVQIWNYSLSLLEMNLVPGGIIGVPRTGDANLFALPFPHQPGILGKVRGMMGKRTRVKDGQWTD